MDRSRQETAELIRAAQERAQPACELGRAALPRFDAFDQVHGALLRHRAELLRQPGLDRGERSWFVLTQARQEVEDLLAVLTSNPATIRTSLATVDGLTREDVEQGLSALDRAFSPNLVFTLIERLTKSAGSVDALPGMLAHFEQTYADLGGRLAHEPRLAPLVDATLAEAPAPSTVRYAKSATAEHGR